MFMYVWFPKGIEVSVVGLFNVTVWIGLTNRLIYFIYLIYIFECIYCLAEHLLTCAAVF